MVTVRAALCKIRAFERLNTSRNEKDEPGSIGFLHGVHFFWLHCLIGRSIRGCESANTARQPCLGQLAG